MAAARETPWSPLYAANHRFSCSEIVMMVLALFISLPRDKFFSALNREMNLSGKIGP
jgi:hypothetical protein